MPSVPGSTRNRGVMVQTISQSRISQSTTLNRKTTPNALKKISSALWLDAFAESAAAVEKPTNESQKGRAQ